jgi:hypothetical protein
MVVVVERRQGAQIIYQFDVTGLLGCVDHIRMQDKMFSVFLNLMF